MICEGSICASGIKSMTIMYFILQYFFKRKKRILYKKMYLLFDLRPEMCRPTTLSSRRPPTLASASSGRARNRARKLKIAKNRLFFDAHPDNDDVVVVVVLMAVILFSQLKIIFRNIFNHALWNCIFP